MKTRPTPHDQEFYALSLGVYASGMALTLGFLVLFWRSERIVRPPVPTEAKFTCSSRLPISSGFSAAIAKHELWLAQSQSGQPPNLAPFTEACVDLAAENARRPISLHDAFLEHADLRGADLSGVDLRGAKLAYARLDGSVLRDARLDGADLGGAYLDGSDLSNAYLNTYRYTEHGQEKERATYLEGAHLRMAELYETRLQRANLTSADLEQAVLVHSHFDNLSDLDGVNLNYTIFEPMDLPDLGKLPNVKSLRFMRYRNDPRSLTKLRDAFRDAGDVWSEKEVTYAIMMENEQRAKRNCNALASFTSVSDCAVYIFNRLFLRSTFEYGLDPARPFVLLIGLTVFCGFWYALIIEYGGASKIVRVRFHKGREKTVRIESRVVPPRIRRSPASRRLVSYFRRVLHVARIGLYFSMQSVLNIGVQGLDFGKWLRMLSKTEYELVPTGFARTLSGIQSLAGLVFFALFLYSAFGHPFSK